MKLHNYKLAASLYGVMLLILLVLLYRVDTVCKQQVDTLDQIMELRQELPEAACETAYQAIPATYEIEDCGMTAADFDLICRVVAAEARGEGYKGQLAVAQVIRDRAQLWGMTPAEVVTAPGQFAEPYQGEVGEDVQAAVNDCLVLGVDAFGEHVTHFCEAGITPYWAEDKQVIGVVGHHRFYR